MKGLRGLTGLNIFLHFARLMNPERIKVLKSLKTDKKKSGSQFPVFQKMTYNKKYTDNNKREGYHHNNTKTHPYRMVHGIIM